MEWLSKGNQKRLDGWTCCLDKFNIEYWDSCCVIVMLLNCLEIYGVLEWTFLKNRVMVNNSVPNRWNSLKSPLEPHIVVRKEIDNFLIVHFYQGCQKSGLNYHSATNINRLRVICRLVLILLWYMRIYEWNLTYFFKKRKKKYYQNVLSQTLTIILFLGCFQRCKECKNLDTWLI